MKQCTFSVLFLIRRTRLLKTGEAVIQMRITANGRFIEMSTQRQILPDEWDQRKERARGKSPAAQEINRRLEWMRTRVYEIQKEMMAKDDFVEPVVIKEILQGKHSTCRMFFEVFEEQIAQMKKLQDIDYTKITIGRYALCLRYFREMFARTSQAKDIALRDVTRAMISDFETFLKADKGVSQNTMIRYMKCVKKITNLAIANGWITVNPFATVKFKEKTVVRDFLTMDELNILRGKEFDMFRLNMVRDVFLFCCFTGLSFIDVYNLTAKDITEDAHGRKWIHKLRQKTEVEFFVPLLEFPLSLIEKYKGHFMCKKSGKIFPVYANQKMNSYLKEIADFCGIEKHLTMHVARYTFATTVTMANDVSLQNVSKMLGHTTTRMTQHYAHVMNESVAKEMGNLERMLKM